MSDEQLQALGLPRREFLKRAAVGAGVFAVPAIVSFGLGGTAEAANGCFPNQIFANQYANTMGSLTISIYTREQQDLVDHDFASKLRAKLLDAEGNLLDGELKGSCLRLNELLTLLQRQSGKKIDPGVASQLSQQLTNVWTQMGCASCT